MAVLHAHQLYRFFHIQDEETAALRGVSLSLEHGEIVAIMGPSGSGKSTLLNCLTGLDEPDAGFVEIMGARITRRPEAQKARLRARRFGIMMQSGNLFAHLRLGDQIALQMHLNTGFDRARGAALLQAVGLGHRVQALPAQLSGGESARAALAVALAADPEILLADEPTAEVDLATEQRLLALFDARRDAGRSTLIATHSEALARHADRVLRLHDGRISHD